MQGRLALFLTFLVIISCRLTYKDIQYIHNVLGNYEGEDLIKIAKTNERLIRYFSKTFLLGSIAERMQNKDDNEKRQILFEQIEENPRLAEPGFLELAFCDSEKLRSALMSLPRRQVEYFIENAEDYFKFFNPGQSFFYKKLRKAFPNKNDEPVNYAMTFVDEYPELCLREFRIPLN